MYLISNNFKENAKKISCFTGPIKGTGSVLPYSSTKKERPSLASRNTSFQPLFSDQSLDGRRVRGASGIIFPIIKGEGVRQMFFPVMVPAYHRSPPVA
ncbi:hypothetical protein SADUNF_Sadunf15G0103300 [Salix dunnii]|uniref:Uncharacterized protein n=1 Tax=Salix dunnii TaxID=1413687 RepID=A0A835JDI8_9ROSI|nr:hypothetical protein SADUNF_Sadunf15G0103300 [Salix dunnii]